MLFQLNVLDQHVCLFLFFFFSSAKRISLSYYRLLQLYILLIQQDNFLLLFANYHCFNIVSMFLNNI